MIPELYAITFAIIDIDALLAPMRRPSKAVVLLTHLAAGAQV